MLLAAFYFAGMHALIKTLVDFHVLEIIFFRSIVTAIICILYLRSRNIPMRGNNQKNLFLRAFFGVMTMSLFFITLQRMPMGASVTLKYLSPIFAAVFAVIFLKEVIRPFQWMFFLTAFAGVLMLKGFDPRIDTLNLVLGITGAVFGGLVYTMIRKIGDTEHPMVIINHFMLFATMLAGIGMIPFWHTPTLNEWVILLGIGTLGYFGQVYMTKALQVELASKVAPIKYSEVIFSLVLGMIWFDEGYSFLSLLGIGVIVGSMLMNLVVKGRFKNHPGIRQSPSSHPIA